MAVKKGFVEKVKELLKANSLLLYDIDYVKIFIN